MTNPILLIHPTLEGQLSPEAVAAYKNHLVHFYRGAAENELTIVLKELAHFNATAAVFWEWLLQQPEKAAEFRETAAAFATGDPLDYNSLCACMMCSALFLAYDVPLRKASIMAAAYLGEIASTFNPGDNPGLEVIHAWLAVYTLPTKKLFGTILARATKNAQFVLQNRASSGPSSEQNQAP